MRGILEKLLDSILADEYLEIQVKDGNIKLVEDGFQILNPH